MTLKGVGKFFSEKVSPPKGVILVRGSDKLENELVGCRCHALIAVRLLGVGPPRDIIIASSVDPCARASDGDVVHSRSVEADADLVRDGTGNLHRMVVTGKENIDMVLGKERFERGTHVLAHAIVALVHLAVVHGAMSRDDEEGGDRSIDGLEVLLHPRVLRRALGKIVLGGHLQDVHVAIVKAVPEEAVAVFGHVVAVVRWHGALTAAVVSIVSPDRVPSDAFCTRGVLAVVWRSIAILRSR